MKRETKRMSNIKKGIYIPDYNHDLHTIDEWMQYRFPKSAQTVVLVSDFGMLEIAKECLPCAFNFEDAQKAAAEYREGFRCPTRHEAIEMDYAMFGGLDEVLKKIGGKSFTNEWTCEVILDPDFPNLAFAHSASWIRTYNKHDLHYVRPVSDFKK